MSNQVMEELNSESKGFQGNRSLQTRTWILLCRPVIANCHQWAGLWTTVIRSITLLKHMANKFRRRRVERASIHLRTKIAIKTQEQISQNLSKSKWEETTLKKLKTK